MKLRDRLLGFVVACCLAGAPALAGDKKKKADVSQIGNRDVGKGINFYSLEREVALGKALAQEVERQSKLVDDPVVTEYVNRVGQNLVRNSDARVPFTIKVIDSDEINAFALPGGFFYVNTGLVLAADEEAELAGVMAHEIAHVTARHATRNATKAELVQLASIGLIFIGGWPGFGIHQAASFLIPLKFLQFSRSAEREADFLGLQYMYKAGYDPNAFISFFEKVRGEEKKRPGRVPKAFSTHPPTPERIVKAQEEIAQVLPSRPEYIVTTSEFSTVKARLGRLEMGRKPKEGDPDRPTLRKRSERADKDAEAQKEAGDSPDDDRPVLKRKPDKPPDKPKDPDAPSNPGS